MVGEPTSEQKKLYKVAWEADQKAVEAIRPGLRGLKIDAEEKLHS